MFIALKCRENMQAAQPPWLYCSYIYTSTCVGSVWRRLAAPQYRSNKKAPIFIPLGETMELTSEGRKDFQSRGFTFSTYFRYDQISRMEASCIVRTFILLLHEHFFNKSSKLFRKHDSFESFGPTTKAFNYTTFVSNYSFQSVL